ncbi:hypothetical protein DK926_26185 [Rhodococcus sp. Eu-32]|uniref:hypothetical protein n=1 Tax=Rhodococcus sp. Eu-32 TaxID=1017319 RepID=UPI000DF3DE86|nr:hypothetical protein [Rhodococcus sp. Eu-32]RRQ24885.1 hypothetical protein DK926_26185 [Rhodococcus sp. Eu-32]
MAKTIPSNKLDINSAMKLDVDAAHSLLEIAGYRAIGIDTGYGVLITPDNIGHAIPTIQHPDYYEVPPLFVAVAMYLRLQEENK